MINSIVSRMTKPKLIYRIWKKFLSFFYNEQWVTLISRSASHEKPAWDDFKMLLPPPDRDWADPFLWKHQGKYYIFVEEKYFTAQHGHISCITLNDQLNMETIQVVLQRPYHLSYPFLFVHNNQLYMMPETLENRAIELYRCVGFPHQWEFCKTLIPNIPAVDATLTQKDGKWWLFANVQDEHGSTWNTLHLFSSDDPLSDLWEPHPQNPIVKDDSSARPAGYIFRENGSLIRPSQDCRKRYGYATNFMHITLLNETNYAETRIRSFVPPPFKKILAIHTWNELDGLTVIDATILRRKP